METLLKGKAQLQMTSLLNKLFCKKGKYCFSMQNSRSKLVSARRSTVMILPFQSGFPASGDQSNQYFFLFILQFGTKTWWFGPLFTIQFDWGLSVVQGLLSIWGHVSVRGYGYAWLSHKEASPEKTRRLLQLLVAYEPVEFCDQSWIKIWTTLFHNRFNRWAFQLVNHRKREDKPIF